MKGLPVTRQGSMMKTVLHIFSVSSVVLGVFWSTYALANGFRAVNGDPFYFVPQAVAFVVLGTAGWAVFGALARIVHHLDALQGGIGNGTTKS